MRVVRAEAGRRVALLMAAKSLKRAVIGTLSKGVGALPVARSMDNLEPGRGAVYLPDPQTQPTLLRGKGTAFDGPGFEVGGTISLPSINGKTHSSRIQEIRGAEELVLKTPFEGQDPILQLTGKRNLESGGPDDDFEGCIFKVAPHVDQTQVYDAVFKRLDADGCIGIFPEGGSHDRPDLLPLKGEFSWRQLSPNLPIVAWKRLKLIFVGSWGRNDGSWCSCLEPRLQFEDCTLWHELLPCS